MSKSKERPDVDALLTERARFETWLEQLAAKAATMPAHVVERVRADYETRLDKVVDELRTRADALRSEAASLEERIGVLQAELTAKRDARAEDELRALVGEYDEDAWQAKAGEHDSSINAVESERSSKEAEHARVLEMLAEATRPSGTRAAAEAPVDAPAVEPDPLPVAENVSPPVQVEAAPAPPPAHESGRSASSAESSQAGSKRASPFDEIGFLRTVVGRTTPFPGLASPHAEIRAVDDSPAPEPPRAAKPDGEPPAKAPERESIPSFVPPPVAEPTPQPRTSSMSLGTTDVSANFTPRDGGGERRPSGGSPDASRSLKCQECGWMNYPTEWYCEKCGGELAAF